MRIFYHINFTTLYWYNCSVLLLGSWIIMVTEQLVKNAESELLDNFYILAIYQLYVNMKDEVKN